jgi:hypothetical protein
VPPIYLLAENYPRNTEDIWNWQTASRILLGISFCFLAWMAKSLGDRRAMLNAALMVPVIVLHVIAVTVVQVLESGDRAPAVVDFLNVKVYPTVLALAAMVGILFGIAVMKHRVTWAWVLIAWGMCGLLEAYLSYEAKVAQWLGGPQQRLGRLPTAYFDSAGCSRLHVPGISPSREETRVCMGLTLPESHSRSILRNSGCSVICNCDN